MIDSLTLYAWPLLASLICGSALALIGTQIAARREEALVLVVNQITVCAYLFVMLLLSLIPTEAPSWVLNGTPKALAVAVGILGLRRLESASIARGVHRLAQHLVLFVGLLSVSHLLAAANSSFEGQFLRSLMGDVVLISDGMARALVVTGAAALGLCWWHRRAATLRSFVRAIWGTTERELGLSFGVRAQGSELLLLGFVCLCTMEFGFLFTSTALLVPTMLMSLSKNTGLRNHGFAVLLLWVLACVGGFVFSMVVQRVPTTPSIGAGLFLIAPVLLSALKWRSAGNTGKGIRP